MLRSRTLRSRPRARCDRWTLPRLAVRGQGSYIEFEVTEFDAPHVIQLETREGPLKPTLTHSFESKNGATHYTRSVRIPMEGMFRLVGPIMKATGAAHKRNARFAENLKELLERSTSRT